MTASTLLVHVEAHAANRPALQRTFPRAGGAERSPYTPQIHAWFDRDLRMPASTFALTGPSGAVVGVTTLSGFPSDTGGYRRISFRPDDPIDEGSYTADVHACAVGGLCTDITFAFEIDDTPPPAPVVTAPLDGTVHREQPMAVRGTAEGGATVTVWEDDEPIAEGIADTTGTYVIVLPYPPADGIEHSIEIFATDRAGNVSVPVARTFVHDSISRPPYITHPGQQQHLNATTIQVAGTAKPGTTVEVFEGATSKGTGLTDASGRWTLTASFTTGTHVVTATAHDSHESTGPSEARTFVIDQTPPPAPVIFDPAPAVRGPEVVVRGSAEPYAVVRIRQSGVIRATAPADDTGDWALIMTFNDNAHTIAAEAVDRAGNVGPQTMHSFVVDSVPPPPPAITAPGDGAFINNATVTISGSAEAGTTVRVFEGPTLLATTTSSGAWTTSVTFLDGAHTVHAVATDAAGNVGSPSVPRSFTVDTVAPAPPTISTPQQGSTVTTDPVVFTGIAEGGAIVTLFNGATPIGSGVADGNLQWRIDVSLADGSYGIHAVAMDAATNQSGSSATRAFSVAVPIDTTPPPAPVITAPAQNGLYRGHVAISGSAEPGSTVTVYVGGTPVRTATASGTGSWATGEMFETGTHTIHAVATDGAGNVGPASAPRTFDVDATRPSATISQADGIVYLSLASSQLSGTAADNIGVARVELEVYDVATGVLVHADDADTCTGCPGTSVTWSAQPVLPIGVFWVRAYAVDTVGNRSQAAVALTVAA